MITKLTQRAYLLLTTAGVVAFFTFPFTLVWHTIWITPIAIIALLTCGAAILLLVARIMAPPPARPKPLIKAKIVPPSQVSGEQLAVIERVTGRRRRYDEHGRYRIEVHADEMQAVQRALARMRPVPPVTVRTRPVVQLSTCQLAEVPSPRSAQPVERLTSEQVDKLTTAERHEEVPS